MTGAGRDLIWLVVVGALLAWAFWPSTAEREAEISRLFWEAVAEGRVGR